LMNVGPMPLALRRMRCQIPISRQMSLRRRGVWRTACAQTVGAVTHAPACQASSWPTDHVSIPQLSLLIPPHMLRLSGFLLQQTTALFQVCDELPPMVVQAYNAASILPHALAARRQKTASATGFHVYCICRSLVVRKLRLCLCSLNPSLLFFSSYLHVCVCVCVCVCWSGCDFLSLRDVCVWQGLHGCGRECVHRL